MDQGMHFPARRVDRDVEWELLGLPDGLDVGNLLYRLYGGDRTPIYIGKTTTSIARLEQHRRHAEWYGLVEFTAMSLYPDHTLLLRAERAAIRGEQPRFNKQDRRGRRRVELDLRGPAEAAAATLLDEADPQFLADLMRILGTPSRSLQAAAPPPPQWDELVMCNSRRRAGFLPQADG
ncbi:GIY-YIG nuclease family protein [Streptomyces tendae]